MSWLTTSSPLSLAGNFQRPGQKNQIWEHDRAEGGTNLCLGFTRSDAAEPDGENQSPSIDEKKPGKESRTLSETRHSGTNGRREGVVKVEDRERES